MNDLVHWLRAASHDDRLSTGALYQAAATAIETLQSELERERKRADEAADRRTNAAERLDAIEAMARELRRDYDLHKHVEELIALILDGKEKL